MDLLNLCNQLPVVIVAVFERIFHLLLMLSACWMKNPTREQIVQYKRTNDTLLHLAIKYEWPIIAKKLLTHYPDLNIQNDEGNTPLHLAIKKHYLLLAQELYAHGANPNIYNHDDTTPLILAMNKKYDILAEKFVKNTPPHLSKEQLEAILTVAVRTNHEAVLTTLLDQNENVNLSFQDHTGSTLLNFAIYHEYFNLIRILLHKGADPLAIDIDGNTTLHIAALKSNIDLVHFFLERGVNPNAKNTDNITPLLLLKFADKKILQILFQNGAEPNTQNRQGQNILHIAFVSDPDLFYHLDTLGEVLAAGAQPLCFDNDNVTPLEEAFRDIEYPSTRDSEVINSIVNVILQMLLFYNYQIQMNPDTNISINEASHIFQRIQRSNNFNHENLKNARPLIKWIMDQIVLGTLRFKKQFFETIFDYLSSHENTNYQKNALQDNLGFFVLENHEESKLIALKNELSDESFQKFKQLLRYFLARKMKQDFFEYMTFDELKKETERLKELLKLTNTVKKQYSNAAQSPFIKAFLESVQNYSNNKIMGLARLITQRDSKEQDFVSEKQLHYHVFLEAKKALRASIISAYQHLEHILKTEGKSLNSTTENNFNNTDVLLLNSKLNPTD